ncbi:MAG: alpha/beta hydrolase, partial [Alphaproteobacteria bacterium PA3]
QGWTHQARDWADVADIHVPHLLGPDTLAGMAEAVIAHAPDRFAVCGFSMGGRVALEVYRRIPERVSRLALVSASIHSIAPGEDEKRKPLLDLAITEGMAALADAWLPRIVHPFLLDNADFMTPLREMALRQTPDDYVREVRALLSRGPVDDVAARVACPVLVVAGDRDPLSTPARNAEIHRLIPHARVVILEDCAHFPMLEYPERTSAELRRWLDD